MLCVTLLQGADSSPVPPALLQLGAAVAICYMVLLITREILAFAGKSTKHATTGDNLTEFRLDRLDEDMKACIMRPEYQLHREELSRQLARIEKLLEQMYSTRILFDPKKQGGD